MSAFTGKKILVIGEETRQITKIEAALITYGAEVTTTTCQSASIEQSSLHAIDLIIVNHLHGDRHCDNVLTSIQNNAHANNAPPIFVLVPELKDYVNDSLVEGATDFITPEESDYAVVEKIRLVLEDSTNSFDATEIDITPKKVANSEGTRIFVIEDDPLLRNLLSIRFQKSNLPFKTVGDGENVVQEVLEFRPQVIILDLMLPGKSGFDILQELKDSEAAVIPVIVFSNKDSQLDRSRALELGAAAFHVKAMTDLSELLEVIESITR